MKYIRLIKADENYFKIPVEDRGKLINMGVKDKEKILELEKIAENPWKAHNYARKLNFKNVPDIIVEGIAKDSKKAYDYAKELNFKNVPDIIMKNPSVKDIKEIYNDIDKKTV